METAPQGETDRVQLTTPLELSNDVKTTFLTSGKRCMGKKHRLLSVENLEIMKDELSKMEPAITEDERIRSPLKS